jgi:serine protease Do
MGERRVKTIGLVLAVTAFAIAGLVLIGGNDAGISGPRSVSPATTAEVAAPARALGAAFATVAARVMPCVVSVSSERIVKRREDELPFPFGDEFLRRFFGERFNTPKPRGRENGVPQHGMGSGIIVDKQGHVLTNFHVVRDVDVIRVITSDKRSFEARTVGSDPKTDVAIIRIEGKLPGDLPVAPLGDSDTLAVGDLVLAMGAPFGLTKTVTSGIISATGRANVGIADFEDFLQTDAAINPGNSGGPLVNMRGEVVGMNTAIATSVGQYSGVGFSIPINMVKKLLPVLVKGGAIKRGMLGIVIQDLSPELARQFQVPAPQPGARPAGALIAQVNPGSPAEKAGLRAGDVVVRFQDKPIEDTQNLRNMVAETPPGSRVELTVIRAGKEQKVTATVGQLTPGPPAGGGPAPDQPGEGSGGASRLGLTVQPLTPELARQLGYASERGVVVIDVESGSAADTAGLRPGDLITEIDRKKIAGLDDLESALGKADPDKGILLLVKRQGASMYIVLRRR